jgi:NADPH-dependent 2,4-dienoyl-CoA reductase/sulfur reductase-like enzyme
MAPSSVIMEQDNLRTALRNRIGVGLESDPSSGPHICVVGAGIAGLRCAEILLIHGIKVTILEARNRIGGRVPSRITSPSETLLS